MRAAPFPRRTRATSRTFRRSPRSRPRLCRWRSPRPSRSKSRRPSKSPRRPPPSRRRAPRIPWTTR
ncbi:MAG: hypothetical protein EBR62_04255 [Verrucomicrobia bacterium]|nr:hypothetical protein [Verrucomicrobiota bacterium]